MAKVNIPMANVEMVAQAFNTELKFGRKNFKIETENGIKISGVTGKAEEKTGTIDWITCSKESGIDTPAAVEKIRETLGISKEDFPKQTWEIRQENKASAETKVEDKAETDTKEKEETEENKQQEPVMA